MTEHRAATSGFSPFAAALALVLVSALTAPTPGWATPSARQVRKPTEIHLARLRQYEHYIEYFAGQGYGPSQSRVSPEYIRALILTESAGQKFAVSHKGARGLTQIMPQTGRMAAAEILASGVDYDFVDEQKLVRYNADLLYDPAVNILIACYLSSLYHTDYRGSHELVAAAWNAGPGAVARYGNVTPPYQETRGMVARLVSYLNYFSVENGFAGRGPRWVDLSHPRWNTAGFNAPGWDTKASDWDTKF